jgi:hypothetical protein
MKRITPRVMVAPTRVWTGEPKTRAGVASAEEEVETSGLMAAVAGAGAAQARLAEVGKLAPAGTAKRLRFSAPVDWPAPPLHTQPSGLTSVPDTTVARQPAASGTAWSTVSMRTSCCRSDGGGQGGMPGPP